MQVTQSDVELYTLASKVNRVCHITRSCGFKAKFSDSR